MLSEQPKTYVFIDPFHRRDSGVSTYTHIAAKILNECNIKTEVIKLLENETIEKFRERVLHEINIIVDDVFCIEAPESLASTKLLSPLLPVHIRLHCSRSLGAAIQGEKYSQRDIDDEQLVINHAKYVSSPSWAAYFASCALFKFYKAPNIYPNPAPKVQKRILGKKKYDILFVGRIHKLKGLAYLEKIINTLPDKSFAVVSPIRSNWKISRKNNVTVFNGMDMTKSEIYNLADIIIVPSLFETSSMVILEAISYGCKVITWEHLGASEYDYYNVISKTSTGNIKSFIKNIHAASLNSMMQNCVTINKINSHFLNGVNNLNNPYYDNQASIKKPSYHCEKYLTNLVRENKLKMKKRSKIFKKTRKLITNPIRFFKDSKLLKSKKQIEEMHEEKTTMLLTKEQSNIAISNEDIEKKLVDSKVKSHFCSIPMNGRIEFPIPPEKPVGYVTLFLHSKNEDQTLINDILSGMHSFNDFTCLKKEHLLIGDFDTGPQEKSISIINRIDLKNKNNLAKINFIFILNPPMELCDALRAIGTEHRIFAIDTNASNYTSLNSVDALITTRDKDISLPIVRRLININSNSHVHIAARKLIQEGAIKNPDMLLELNPENEVFSRDDFIKFDYIHFDGIIKTKKIDNHNFTTMEEFYSKMSDNILGIAMKESIYMRYKSLCEEVEKGIMPKKLLEKILMDGAIFDVKEI